MFEGRIVEISTEEWAVAKDLLTRLNHHVFGNGKPALETRLHEYIDRRDTHKENNAAQMVADLRDETNDRFDKQEKKQDERHEQNQEKFDKLFQLGYVGLGIVITLQAFGLLHK